MKQFINATTKIPFNVEIVKSDNQDLGRHLIKFYDDRFHSADAWKVKGQFIASYYLNTILGIDDWSNRTNRNPLDHMNCGLNLDGGIPDWSICAETMREIIFYSLQEVA